MSYVYYFLSLSFIDNIILLIIIINSKIVEDTSQKHLKNITVLKNYQIPKSENIFLYLISPNEYFTVFLNYLTDKNLTNLYIQPIFSSKFRFPEKFCQKSSNYFPFIKGVSLFFIEFLHFLGIFQLTS